MPLGTSVTVYSMPGERLSNRLGQAIELNVDLSGIRTVTYTEGMEMQNLTLDWQGRLQLMGNSGWRGDQVRVLHTALGPLPVPGGGREPGERNSLGRSR